MSRLGCTVMGVGVLKAVGAGAAGESGAVGVTGSLASASLSVSSSSMIEMSRMDGRCDLRQPVKHNEYWLNCRYKVNL